MNARRLGSLKLLLFMMLVMALVVSGCKQDSGKEPSKSVTTEGEGNEENEGVQENEGEKEEVTITIAHPFGDDIFESRYLSIEGLPDHIKLDHVYWNESREGLEALFAEGIEPDIFNSGSVELLQEYEAIIPIDELVDKHGFDTSVIQPSLIAFLESYDKDQRIIGVPDGGSYYALYFNKEIFDIFGVDYPDQDKPMTWSEALDLARKMTAERNGTEYIGMEFHNNDMSAPINQFGVNLTDPETGEVLVLDSPEIQSYLELVEEYYNIPGMKEDEITENCMFCQKKAAISIAWHGLFLGWGDDTDVAKDMDIAPLPVWPEKPNTGPYLASYPIMVSSLTEHPDEAFEVLKGYVSEQNQLKMSRTASAGPATLYPSVQEEFAADNPFYDGKNVLAIFKLDPEVGEDRQSGKWDRHIPLWTALDKLRTSNTDIPTILREIKEEAEISIKEAMESGE